MYGKISFTPSTSWPARAGARRSPPHAVRIDCRFIAIPTIPHRPDDDLLFYSFARSKIREKTRKEKSASPGRSICMLYHTQKRFSLTCTGNSCTGPGACQSEKPGRRRCTQEGHALRSGRLRRSSRRHTFDPSSSARR